MAPTQTLATGKHHSVYRRRARAVGFSLLELLVVVVILGLLTGIVVPRLSTMALTENALLRMHRQFVYASHQSTLSGQAIGLSMGRAGYRFVSKTKDSWQPLAGALAPITLDAGESIEFYVAGKRVASSAPSDEVIAVVDELGDWPDLRLVYRHTGSAPEIVGLNGLGWRQR